MRTRRAQHAFTKSESIPQQPSSGTASYGTIVPDLDVQMDDHTQAAVTNAGTRYDSGGLSEFSGILLLLTCLTRSSAIVPQWCTVFK